MRLSVTDPVHLTLMTQNIVTLCKAKDPLLYFES